MKKKINFKKLIPWLLFALVVGGLITWILLSKRTTQEELDTYDRKLDDAVLQIAAREYSTAINILYEAIDIVPEKVNAYEKVVEVLLSKNRVDDATEIVEKSARKVSANDQAVLYALLGDYYYSVKDYTQAKNMYQECVGIGINYPTGELAYAKNYIQQGKLDEAKSLLMNSGYTDDLKYEADLLLAYIQATENTETASTTVKSVTPSDKWKIYYEEMENVLDDLDEDEKFNATKLSRVYINNGYPYLAISVLQPLEEEMAAYLEGMYFLGRAYYENGEYQKCIDTLDKASSLGGLETEIFWTEARAYMMSDNLEESVDKYDKAVLYSGEAVSQDLVEEYINILLENNQGLKAEEVLKTVLNYTEEARVRILLVQTYYLLEDSDKVDYYLDQLAKLELTDAEKKDYLYWSINVDIENDATTELEGKLDELLALGKYNAKYYYLLARIDFANGDSDQSQSNLEKCLEYDLDYEITDSALKLLSRVK